MFYEFRFCYSKICELIEAYDKPLKFDKNDNNLLTELSYLIFFHGIGLNSSMLTLTKTYKLVESTFLMYLLTKIMEITSDFNKENPKLIISKYKDVKDVLTPKYKPINGHLSRLPHYFRHLFHTIKLIDKEENLTEQQKMEYAKTLRAQLSDYEQLLLYYNTCSSLGNAWLNENGNLIKKYRIIKNMPVAMADFGITPQEKFKEEILYWNNEGENFINGI